LYGGGGGAGGWDSTLGGAGGNGAQGLLIITYTPGASCQMSRSLRGVGC
jgi:hypothetical protein